MKFSNILEAHSWNSISKQINNKTKIDVEHALNKTSQLSLNEMMALLSPAAEPYIEQMAQKSHQLTLKRFGKTIQLFVPLYLSNECTNFCTYCGFNHDNNISRKTLTKEEIQNELLAIKKLGFKHILLVTGEHPAKVNANYLIYAVKKAREIFPQVSIEVQPLDTNEYVKLINNGLHSVYVYQETYHKQNYNIYHPKGKKANFEYRLETPERLGEAGIHKIGMGVLLGLENWRTDAFMLASHINYLSRKYWKTKFSISFPRLRPHAGSFNPNYDISDKYLVQLICAFRLFDENLEMTLSTRESKTFRDKCMQLGVTSYSAGSKTEPGGYAQENTELKQFEIDDNRTPNEVELAITANGYEAIWKDWDIF